MAYGPNIMIIRGGLEIDSYQELNKGKVKGAKLLSCVLLVPCTGGVRNRFISRSK